MLKCGFPLLFNLLPCYTSKTLAKQHLPFEATVTAVTSGT